VTPLVSVIIPTVGRPDHVVGATRSALGQSLQAVEVVVVVDGLNEATTSALAEIDDPRLRVFELASRTGPGGARNVGVAESRGEWVAFLDDDDLWDPHKLEIQLEAARSSGHDLPVIACREVARGGGRSEIWPRRLPEPGEHLSEYLLARRGLFWGEGTVHTSTWFTRRELLERVPFRQDLKKHEDWDWLLRAADRAGAAVTFVPESLAVRSVDEGRPRASRSLDWRFGLAHIRECRELELVTPRAYASFLLTILSAEAAEERSAGALWALPWEATRRGRPRPVDLLVCLGNFLLPRGLRTRLRYLTASAQPHSSALAAQTDPLPTQPPLENSDRISWERPFGLRREATPQELRGSKTAQ
jgi:GT2 family glycosyltransferase